MGEQRTNVRLITTRIINQVWSRGDPNKAVLAALRNSKDVQSHHAAQVWPILLDKLPAGDLSTDGTPTRTEQATFTALRCYALYQQGCDMATFDPQGPELFSALATIRNDDDLKQALDRRVRMLLGTRNYNSMATGLIHLVQIVKAKGTRQPINFATLAQDLQYFQYNSRSVAFKWGQQYYWQSQTSSEK